jgi:hypothetical protein
MKTSFYFATRSNRSNVENDLYKVDKKERIIEKDQIYILYTFYRYILSIRILFIDNIYFFYRKNLKTMTSNEWWDINKHVKYHAIETTSNSKRVEMYKKEDLLNKCEYV